MFLNMSKINVNVISIKIQGTLRKNSYLQNHQESSVVDMNGQIENLLAVIWGPSSLQLKRNTSNKS